jgi:hypothetical protein
MTSMQARGWCGLMVERDDAIRCITPAWRKGHMEHTSISPEETADRLAIREPIDACAHCVDGREAEEQKGSPICATWTPT